MKGIVRAVVASPLLLAVVAQPIRAAPQGATAIDTIGPQIGAAIPRFEGTDQFGRTQTLERSSGPKGAMLVFFRSADW